MNTLIAEHTLGMIVARYIQPIGSNRCELHLVPVEMREAVVEPRLYLDEDRVEIRDHSLAKPFPLGSTDLQPVMPIASF